MNFDDIGLNDGYDSEHGNGVLLSCFGFAAAGIYALARKKSKLGVSARAVPEGTPSVPHLTIRSRPRRNRRSIIFKLVYFHFKFSHSISSC